MGGLIGARIPRLEDGALLVGKGRFIDDIVLAGVLHAAFVRSPHPHAAIRAVDVRGALALPGVQAVLTLDDLAPVLAKRRMLRHSNSGTPLDRYWSFALADGEVSYVGEAVALVLADNRYVAEDAAALVAVDYDVLPSVADCRKAAAADAHPRYGVSSTPMSPPPTRSSSAMPRRPLTRPRMSFTKSSGSTAAPPIRSKAAAFSRNGAMT